MDAQVIFGVASVLGVVAAWDAARRHFASKGSAFASKLAVLELAQKGTGEELQKLKREMVEVGKLAASADKPKLSRFQR